MGIGGVGMAGVAFLLRQAGRRVSGCDLYDTPRTRWLEANGIPVARAHDPAHTRGISELVVTPAVPPDAPELAAARADPSVRVRWRGEVLAELVNAADGIAVCGTHGKTTTATFITRLLRALGDDPAWCIGGETGDQPVAGTGTGPLVVEADESDGTLALYRPRTLVLNAVDFDHLEHFASPEAYFDCYRAAIRQTRDTLVVCRDHAGACALLPQFINCGRKILTFGFSPEADVRADDWPGIPVLGRHNVLNALAAVAVALARGHAPAAVRAALPAAVAELPARRFDRVARAPGLDVYTDYAHHPAELACALAMARELQPARLRVMFQPHRYSRTRALLDEFPPAFDTADETVLVPVYPAFESPLPGGDIADLYAAFRARHTQNNSPAKLLLARSAEEAWRHLFLTAQPGDLLMLLGAGDLVRVLPQVRADVAAFAEGQTSSAEGQTPRVWTPLAPLSFFRTGGQTCSTAPAAPLLIGMGSNTWFSDCATDRPVKRVFNPAGSVPDDPAGSVPAALPGAALVRARPGLAFLAGVPGTVGGWVRMNAGAFGHEIGEFVQSVRTTEGDFPAAACGFAYRHSEIAGEILSVTFTPAAAQPLDADADAFRARRPDFPPRTCGSVFKNPPDDSAGRLLDAAGCKSLRVGGASVWSRHANVIVAGPGCTSSDILALARLMVLAVRFKFNITLTPEIRNLDV